MHRFYANINDALPDLARYVLDGEEVGSRDGSRVMERLHETITLTEPRSRYMLLPGRKASLPAQIAETMWVLSGRDDVDWLSTYLPRAPQFSDDGKVWRGAYGPRLRAFGRTTGTPDSGVDQLAHVVDLLKKDPLTRRAVIGIYDGAIDSGDYRDVPCNDLITFQSRLGKLHMHVFVRSNDLVWGWSGINTFEWSVLQEAIAAIIGVGVGNLTFATSSLHIYDRHWKKMRDMIDSHPTAGFTPWDKSFDAPWIGPLRSVEDLDQQVGEWFRAEELIREYRSYWSALRAAESAGVNPLFRDWLRVIAAWWWRVDEPQVKSHTLRAALALSPKRKLPEPEVDSVDVPRLWGGETVLPNWEDFVESVCALHKVKHKSYGDSWKKRGETLGILANIARKVDRLGATDQYETALDTATDMLVYIAKYESWIADQVDDGIRSDGVDDPDARIFEALSHARNDGRPYPVEYLAADINDSALDEGWAHLSPDDKASVLKVLRFRTARHIHNIWKEQNK